MTMCPDPPEPTPVRKPGTAPLPFFSICAVAAVCMAIAAWSLGWFEKRGPVDYNDAASVARRLHADVSCGSWRSDTSVTVWGDGSVSIHATTCGRTEYRAHGANLIAALNALAAESPAAAKALGPAFVPK